MKALIFSPTEADLFANVYTVVRVGDPFIAGRERMNALTKVFDKLDALADIDKDANTLTMQKAGGAVELEDAEFGILRECATLVCEQGVNPRTAETKQVGRIFDSRTAIKILDFLDAAKAPAPKVPAPVVEPAEPALAAQGAA